MNLRTPPPHDAGLPPSATEDPRVIVLPIINVEYWDIREALPRTVMPAPQGAAVVPDVASYGWYEYGIRCGFARMKRVLDDNGIRATLSLNAVVCDHYPWIVKDAMDAGWEVLAHGYVQRVINAEPDERAAIRRARDRIREFTGTAPRGWLGPGMAETADTPDILAEEGFEYVLDWCNDDRPYYMNVREGELLAVPYTVELNDIPIYLVQNHRSRELLDRTRDQFATLYEEGAASPRIMAISTHPNITGVPHRIRYYREVFDYLSSFRDIAFMTCGEVVDWHRSTSSARDGAAAK